MAETVNCKAVMAFVHYAPDFGMIVGNPSDENKAAKFPEVPVGQIRYLVEQGYIVDPDLKTTPAVKPAPATPVMEEVKAYIADHVGGGYYRIVGPNAPEGKLKKADVADKLAELEAAHAAANAPAAADATAEAGDEGELSDEKAEADADDGAGHDDAPVA
jgi:hypothetical protein